LSGVLCTDAGQLDDLIGRVGPRGRWPDGRRPHGVLVLVVGRKVNPPCGTGLNRPATDAQESRPHSRRAAPRLVGKPSGDRHERDHQAAGAGTHVASPLPAALPPAVRPRGDLAREVLACLASGPKSRAEIRGIVGCCSWDVYKAVRKLLRAGAAVEVGKGCYAAIPGAQARIGDPARLSRMILAFLAAPRRIGEVARHAGAPRGTVRGRVDALICTGQAAKVSQGLYVATGRPRAVPGVPAAPRSAPCSGRRQPIRDAILAFLGEPRQAQDVAAHIGRPVSTATGHLAAMRRRGLVLRIAPGRYQRAEPTPDRVRRAAIAGPEPDGHGNRGTVPVRTALAGAWACSGHLDADALQEARPDAPGGPTAACAGGAPPRRMA